MARYLLADVGSTFTKLLSVETDPPGVVAQAASPTTIATDVNLGFEAALSQLFPGAAAGISPTAEGSVDGRPDAVEPGKTLVCSSAAGGLRIVAVGLVPDLTMKAARLAALGAGGTVVGAFSFVLTEEDHEHLQALAPDLVLLTGGTDGGDTAHIVQNAQRLAEWLPRTPLVIAGNRSARDELRRIFAGRPDVWFADNVLPDLKHMNLEPARRSIRAVFLERIVEAKGLARLRSRARVVMPTPEAVLRAVSLLVKGSGEEAGLGELMAVDMGGATTDVYSCADGRPRSERVVLRGVPEPFEKRTVEADIGMRYTLPHLVDQLDLAAFGREHGLDAEDLAEWIKTVSAHTERLPLTPLEERMDAVLAAAGCALAVERHCGRLEEAFTPEGRVFLQDGKDLGDVAVVVGTGGPVAHSADPAAILGGCIRRPGSLSLKPIAPRMLVDTRYLLWAMGLLAEVEPTAALTLMKENLAPCGKDRTRETGDLVENEPVPTG